MKAQHAHGCRRVGLMIGGGPFPHVCRAIAGGCTSRLPYLLHKDNSQPAFSDVCATRLCMQEFASQCVNMTGGTDLIDSP